MKTVVDNRRRTARVGLPARAFIRRRGSDEPIEFGVRDLSTGGARLVGQVRLQELERVRLELQLGGGLVSLLAEVVHTDPQHMQVAVVFCDAPLEAIELIDASVVTFIEAVRTTQPPTILAYQISPALCAALERDFAQLGRRTSSCATRLELMASLHEPTARCEAVVLSATADQLPELLKSLAEDHPRVRRLVLFLDQLGSLDHLSSRHVDAVLRTPWRLRPLARAVGITSADSSVAMLPSDD